MLADDKTVNLLDSSLTYPELFLDPLIPLDSKIGEMKRKFGPQNQSMIVKGSSGSGKTVHLAEFVKANSNVCFSYFITDNYWSRRQTAFLASLSHQMERALGGKSDSVDHTNLDSERLRIIFEGLVQRVISMAKRTNSTYYFVVDGLELAFEGNPGERISDLLPLPTNPRYLYFLGSISSSASYLLKFDYLVEEPRTFSSLESVTYLDKAGIHISAELLNKIQTTSGGVPGYLSALRRLHVDKIQDIANAIEKPYAIEDLLKIQWTASVTKAINTEKLILALIAHSITPLTISAVSEMTEQPKAKINEFFVSSGLLGKNKENGWGFYPDLLKKIAQGRLQSLRNHAISLLITYYEKRRTERESGFLLPEYYLLSNDYSGIEDLLKPSDITRSISEFRDLSVIRNILNHAKDLAYKQSKKLGLIKYGLLSSQLKSLSNEVIGESEVKALISLDEFDKALELTYAVKVAVLRIRLLARIYAAMEKKGVTVSKSSLDELKQMVVGLETRGLDPKEILLTAADIFPILPDVSTALIDKTKGQQDPQTAMDLIYALASIQSENTSDDNIISKIENENLQELALRSPWLTKLTSAEIISKASSASHTKAKLFLLREWCLQNKADPNLHNVTDVALDVINSDTSFKVPLRHLRQLSSALRNCAPDHIVRLAHRFDIPNFTGLQSPIEERVRLELNIAEAINLVLPNEAWARFCRIYEEIKNLPLDTDVSCYCYARFLISITLLDPQDLHKLRQEIEDDLQDEFLRLIDTSADQLDLTRRILRSMSAVRPELGLTFAEMLNTTRRRDEGIREVLIAYMRQDRISIKARIIEAGLAKIKDEAYRAITIIELLSAGNQAASTLESQLRTYFAKKVDEIHDPILGCKGLAQLIVAYNGEQDAEIRGELFEKLVTHWAAIDIAWIRTEGAFDWVSQIGNADWNLAIQLYEKAVELRETVPLANQTVGKMFLDTLDTVAGTIGFIDLKNEKHVWDELLQLVELLPSRALKARTLSKIALARLYKKGDQETFNYLMQDYVLTELQLLAPSHTKDSIVAEIAAALYEYSPEEAIKLIKSLPYNRRNYAWMDMSARILLQINLGDNYDRESPNVSIDLQRANKSIAIIENSDNDEVLYLAVDLLTHLVALQHSHLNEQQKLDILTRLDTIVDNKLPDINNIDHFGYKVLAKSSIESARRRSVKKAKSQIKKNHNQIIQDARCIDNIADRVIVMSLVAVNFREIENQLAIAALDEAFANVDSIPNVKDRIDRLEVIANSYKKLNNTSATEEAVRLAVRLSSSLDGIEKDTVLASLIQTAHQVDKDIAAEITEKIEDSKTEHELDVNNTAYDLSRAPHKLFHHFEEASANNEIMQEAAIRMIKAVNSNKGVAYQDRTMLDWLAAGANLEYDTMLEIIKWVTDVSLRQCPDSALPQESLVILQTLIENCNILYSIGSQVLPLAKIPESIRTNFQGLSISKELFRVGERTRAVSWIKNWLQSNAKGYVTICDPYFEETQVWLLQLIPVDLQVRIISSGKKFGFTPSRDDPVNVKKINKGIAKGRILASWQKISSQAPPATFVVIHGSVYEGDRDSFHDRYIVTDGAGISIGTSLNGLGNQESLITVLNPDDVKYVEATYISPKLSIDKLFSRSIYFELEE